jgi:flagellar FliL protein
MSDKKPDAKPDDGAKPEGKEEAAPGGGVKSWLPLIASVVLMPVLALATTKFLILPKIVQAREAGRGEEEREEHGSRSEGHEPSSATENKENKEPKGGNESKEAAKPKEAKEGKDSGKGHGAGATAGKKKQSVPITKVIVNVAGSMGSRYLMTSFTLVGTHNEFKNIIEENKDQLLDLANNAMASKTITDLEKPGARNQLRAELISIFNNALGGSTVQEIYFTEFAVQ